MFRLNGVATDGTEREGDGDGVGTSRTSIRFDTLELLNSLPHAALGVMRMWDTWQQVIVTVTVRVRDITCVMACINNG